MKGRNTIQINQATMVEAIQYWLKREMVTAPTVLSVTKDTRYTIGADIYNVEVETPEEPS